MRAHRRADRRHAGRGARHGDVLRDVQVRAGRQVPHQHLRHDVVRAARRRRADAPRRSARSASRPASTTADGLITLEHAECQAACTEAPTLQVNYRHRFRVTDGRLRPAGRRPALRPARRRDPAARHARHACASTSPPTAASVPCRPRTCPPARPGSRSHRPGGACMSSTAVPTRGRPGTTTPATGRRSSRRGSSTRTRTRSSGTSRPAATRGSARRSPRRPGRRPRRGPQVATVLGRGGAGFPAGVKWGLTPQGVWPRYLVVNGDESEPGTYKDRLLMELDPHQLIEGCLIACYAAGLSQCFLYIRGEMALAQERVATGAQRGLRGRLRRQEHPRHRLLRRHRAALGRRRLRRRRGDGADRAPRGRARHAAPQAAVLPGRSRPVRQADDRQQRRDAGQPAVASPRNGVGGLHRDRHRDLARARAWSPCPVTSSGRACSRSSTAPPRSAT